MSLNKVDIAKIANLARLAVSEDEYARYETELSNTMDLIGNLQKVDTSTVQPMAHPLHCIQRMRDDIVTATDEREKFQAIAPSIAAGLYLVPKVIE